MKMLRMVLLILLQSLLLCSGQVLLKLAMSRVGAFAWSWPFVRSILANVRLLAAGLCFVGAGLMWLYILKHFPFSKAYPLSSITFLFGMVAAVVVLGEPVVWSQWLGVLLIMGGCFLVIS